MKFILALLLAIFAVVFAENTATGLSVDVTEEDVKLTPASLAEFGPVPKCFDFSFRLSVSATIASMLVLSSSASLRSPRSATIA